MAYIIKHKLEKDKKVLGYRYDICVDFCDKKYLYKKCDTDDENIIDLIKVDTVQHSIPMHLDKSKNAWVSEHEEGIDTVTSISQFYRCVEHANSLYAIWCTKAEQIFEELDIFLRKAGLELQNRIHRSCSYVFNVKLSSLYVNEKVFSDTLYKLRCLVNEFNASLAFKRSPYKIHYSVTPSGRLVFYVIPNNEEEWKKFCNTVKI